jgi:hypothetical protein
MSLQDLGFLFALFGLFYVVVPLGVVWLVYRLNVLLGVRPRGTFMPYLARILSHYTWFERWLLKYRLGRAFVVVSFVMFLVGLASLAMDSLFPARHRPY